MPEPRTPEGSLAEALAMASLFDAEPEPPARVFRSRVARLPRQQLPPKRRPQQQRSA